VRCGRSVLLWCAELFYVPLYTCVILLCAMLQICNVADVYCCSVQYCRYAMLLCVMLFCAFSQMCNFVVCRVVVCYLVQVYRIV